MQISAKFNLAQMMELLLHIFNVYLMQHGAAQVIALAA